MYLLLVVVGFTTSLAAAASRSKTSKCAERVATPQPLSDEEFLSQVGSSLDAFWSKVYNEGHLTLADLGLTRATLSSLELNEPAEARNSVYQNVRLHFYNGMILTPVGEHGDIAPYYSLPDYTVYISLGWLMRAFGSRIGIIWSFIIGHEVGHNVQAQLKLLDLVEQLSGANQDAFITRLELQSDCLGSFWLRRSYEVLKPGELDMLEELISMIGYKNHGSGEQRLRWFRKGWNATRIRECDTFSIPMTDL